MGEFDTGEDPYAHGFRDFLASPDKPRNDFLQVGPVHMVSDGHTLVPEFLRPPRQLAGQEFPVAKQGVEVEVYELHILISILLASPLLTRISAVRFGMAATSPLENGP